MTYTSEVLADSPTAYWRLREATGAAVAIDSSGNGHDGSYLPFGKYNLIDGPLITDVGGSMYVPGTDAMTVPHSSALNPSSITVEAWVYGDPTGSSTWGTTNNSDVVFAKKYDNVATNPVHDYLLMVGTRVGLSNNWHRVEFMITGSVTQTVYSDVYIAVGTWYHIVATYDGSTVKLYIDARLVASASLTGSVHNGAQNLLIGKASTTGASANRDMEGTLGELAVYSSALSQARIQAHYDAGRPLSATPPSPPDAYGAQVVADAPTSFWRLQELNFPTARDTMLTAGATEHLGIYRGQVQYNRVGLECGNYPAGHSIKLYGVYGNRHGFVEVDHSAAFVPGSGSFSLEGWLADDVGSSNKPFFSKTRDNPDLAAVHTDYRLTPGIFTVTIGGTEYSVSSTSFSTPIYVVATYDGANLKIYWDGTLVGTQACTGAIDNLAGQLLLGAEYISYEGEAFGQSGGGLLQDLAYYPYALSAAQVLNHYLIGTAMAAPVALPATGITTAHFIANWAAYPNATSYRLDVSFSPTFVTFFYNNLNVGNVTSRTVPIGITPTTNVYYRVRAVTRDSIRFCTSPNSNVIHVSQPRLMRRMPQIIGA